MKQVSNRRAGTLRARGRIVRRHHAPPTCVRHPAVFGCDAAAVDTHELTNRSQADTAAVEWVMVPLCRGCHDWVGEHPAEAEAAGWRVPGWKYRQNQETDTNVYERVMVSGVAEPKDILTARVSPAANAYVDKIAGDEGVSRADVTRAMLSVATQHPEEILAKVRALSAADRIGGPPPPTRRGRPQPKAGRGQ